MSVIDQVLEANREYAREFQNAHLHHKPARHLAILACMDARISVEHTLGLKPGDAHIIRNAGGIATEDALRSLIVSHHMLETREIMVINHTECGMMSFRDEDLRHRLEEHTGIETIVPVHFHTFTDLEKNVRRQMQRIRTHPWIPPEVVVRGFVYDVKTGLLNEVAYQGLRAAV
jgi:carbonic anhydrase